VERKGEREEGEQLGLGNAVFRHAHQSLAPVNPLLGPSSRFHLSVGRTGPGPTMRVGSGLGRGRPPRPRTWPRPSPAYSRYRAPTVGPHAAESPAEFVCGIRARALFPTKARPATALQRTAATQDSVHPPRHPRRSRPTEMLRLTALVALVAAAAGERCSFNRTANRCPGEGAPCTQAVRYPRGRRRARDACTEAFAHDGAALCPDPSDALRTHPFHPLAGPLRHRALLQGGGCRPGRHLLGQVRQGARH
jgi:hypothetical protein